MDINSLINHEEDDNYDRGNCTFINPVNINYKPIDELNYETIDKLNYEPTESFLNELNYSQESFNKFEQFDYLQEIFNESEQSNYCQECFNKSKQLSLQNQLKVKEIIYLLLPMEYSPTSEDRIAIIYNIEAWNNSEAFINN
ncbi:11799_t:CDS:2, partial [Gigaspora margarita]